MEIVKVIVKGELPEGCNECFLATSYGNCVVAKRACWYTSDDGKEDFLYSYRPDWCPLVKEGDYDPATERFVRNANEFGRLMNERS